MTTILVTLFSISFNAQTEIKTTKLEEDQKRAFAAAESILETSLKNNIGTYTLGGNLNLPNLNTQFSGSATVAETTGPTYTTPLVQKDDEYTFYFAHFDNPGFSSYFNGAVYIYLASESGSSCPNGPAVEVTYIKNDNSLTHDLIDPCNLIAKNGGTDLSTLSSSGLNGVSFQYVTQSPITIAGNVKLMILHVLSTATKLGIQRVNGDPNLPSQGRLTSVQAQTSDTHTSSSMNLFQSYPQIPASFFITSF